MTGDVIADVAVHVLRVTPKTLWTFIVLRTAGGLTGTGEATLTGRESGLAATAARWRGAWIGEPVAPDLTGRTTGCASLVEAAVASAFDQALWDILAQSRGERLAQTLGGLHRERVPLYANINRGTLDRSPAGFAASARRALAHGYDAFKIAPFDELAPALEDRVFDRGLERGLERIAAVREAIGPSRDLMVDCHWRFTETSAARMIAAVSAHGLYWVECPLPETADNLAALKRLRGLANARGMRLAGCEEGIRTDGFAPFLEAGAYDVMMPDVKYVGGLHEMLRIADRLRAHGVAVSPHNPSGPVCHAASLHVCAAVPVLDRLEVQFDETPLFAALAGGALPVPKAGVSPLPDAVGLGIALDPGLTQSLAVDVAAGARVA
ncbi:MAG TPA: mandelate racemase/muconate lactonizing enzyme family protein [Microvirga sp.]|jgi:galactonate dehydratase|nr:mandelate racemase/muconate lactonizing enzyme family protein [Microvirga sp.]